MPKIKQAKEKIKTVTKSKSKDKEKKVEKTSDFENKILAYALDNAILHDGKCQEGAIIGKLFQEGLKKEDLPKIIPTIRKIANDVNKISLDKQKENFDSLQKLVVKKEHIERKDLPELPNAVDGKVILRLAPFPSGALHIGNAKTYMLNALYAEKYHGKILFIIDDTIGSEQKQLMPEAYTLIPEAFKWLKVKYEEPIYYKSDRLDIYYKYAEELISKGYAYVCSCDSETLRNNRAKGIACIHRKQKPQDTLKEWKKMFSMKEGQACLRLKTNMQDKNPAFRDRVLFRISEREHPRVGKKYRVWPMLEFSWAIDDHLLGITHVIRGKDLMMESDMERFIWKIFGWKPCELIHAGLVRIEGLEGVKISKSKAQEQIKSGEFSGWDDPRTWSVQSLKRRGFLPEAIREFIKSIGLNQNDIVIPVDNLYAINKKMIDPTSKRFFFVRDPIKIKINKAPKETAIIHLLPDNETHGNEVSGAQKAELSREAGVRKIPSNQEVFIAKNDFDQMKTGELFRLMGLYNFTRELTSFGFHSKEINPKFKSKYIHWLPGDKENEKNLVKIQVLMDNGEMISGLGEEGIKNLKVNDIIQFERMFYARLDKIDKKTMTYYFWFTHK